MAKQQTFGDKLKKQKQEAELLNVKVLRTYKSDRGTRRFSEKFVKVKDIAELDKIDFNKEG